MKRCKHTYQIFDFLENTLQPEQSVIMEMHLKECKECMESMAILQKSLQIIESQKEVKPNPFFISHVEARLHKKEVSRSHFYKRVLQPVFVFSIILISLAGGYFLASSVQSSGNSVSSQEYQEYVFQEPIELALQNN